MTPREITLVVDAHAARTHHDAALIWQLGQYVAVGVNAPKKYPKPPKAPHSFVPLPDDEPMDEEMMKTMLGSFAKSHNANVARAGGDMIGGNA